MNSGLYALLGGASATAIAAACANRFDGPGTNASNVYAGNGRPGAPIARCAGVGGNTARGLRQHVRRAHGRGRLVLGEVEASPQVLVDLQPNGQRVPGGLGRGVTDQLDVVTRQAIPHVLGRREQLEDVPVEGGGTHLGEPHRDRALGKGGSRSFDDV